ncbi:MAG TPA: hypothetical protein VEH04_04950 [Verrucomicrobiae bacterium]|nr:hypothetical protein [Verrucomicrobiae bacterium]
MTNVPGRIREHFSNWRQWELNPVVVKELRQAVRSWAVTGMLLLFLAVLFCTALGLLITQTVQFHVDQRVGASIFQVFTGILTGASLLFIPLYVGVRLAAERQDANLDLLYITTLTPARIIRGKFLCGAYMTVLFFSACMPFMAFTNLLRGVDLPTVAFILVCLFAVVCIAVQIAIFVACLPISRLFKVLLALFGIGWIMPAIAWLTFVFYSMMQSGVGSLMGTSNFWNGFFLFFSLALAGTILLYLLSVALISPPSANRAFALRGYLTCAWLIGCLVALYWVFKIRTAQVILVWGLISLSLLALAMVVVVSNHDALSLRVRRDIPANPFKRATALLFFNGAAGGIIWISLLSFITVGVMLIVLHGATDRTPAFQTMSTDDLDEFTVSIIPTVLYALAYALTGLFLQRRFMPRRSPKLAGIFTVLIPAVLALAPNIALFFANRLSFRAMEATQFGNVFNIYMVHNWPQRTAHLICAAIWIIIAVLLNARWFANQIKAFRPLEKWTPAPPPLPGNIPPVMQTGEGVS